MQKSTLVDGIAHDGNSKHNHSTCAGDITGFVEVERQFWDWERADTHMCSRSKQTLLGIPAQRLACPPHTPLGAAAAAAGCLLLLLLLPAQRAGQAGPRGALCGALLAAPKQETSCQVPAWKRRGCCHVSVLQ